MRIDLRNTAHRATQGILDGITYTRIYTKCLKILVDEKIIDKDILPGDVIEFKYVIDVSVPIYEGED